MLLSIGMMVKNEEKYLEQCLSSLMPILNHLDSELIIVDTGSEDNTVEIAKKYTDKVYFHRWNNNFSEMRNITLSYCKGDWFFVIDGDEILENCDDIIHFFQSKIYKNYKSATLLVKNLNDLSDQTNYSILTSIRLFKKDKDFKFINAIHNQPLYKEPTKALSTICTHYGYISTDKELMEKKFNRTVTILKNELKKDPKNIYYLFQLSVSYSMHNDNHEALISIEQAYKYMIEKKENVKNYIYVYQQLCLCYFNVNDYSNVEKYAKESLKFDKNIIDIYYCLGVSLRNLKKFNEAIKALESYIALHENYSNRDKNISIVDYTAGRVNQVYDMLYILNREIKEYGRAKQYLLKITDDGYDIPKNIVELCVNTKEYNEIKKYEEDLLSKSKIQEINKLYMYLEDAKLKMDKEEAKILTRNFSSGSTPYNYLNKIRTKYENDKTVDINEMNTFLENIDLASEPFYFGDLLFYIVYSKNDLSGVSKDLTFEKINEFLQYSTVKYKEFHEAVYRYLKKFMDNEDFYSIRINKELCRYLILLNKLDKDKLESIFIPYLNVGIKYMNTVYSDFVLENEYWQVTRTQEEKFFIYINKANSHKTADEKEYLNYLRSALKAYPNMKNVIEYLFDKHKQQNSQETSEFEKYKLKVKNTIKSLIDHGNLEDARALINEYEEIVKDDAEICSMKSVIFISSGHFIKAEEELKRGMNIDNSNFDLYYNLGYLYDIQKRNIEALSVYSIAKLVCEDDYHKKMIEENIVRLCNKKINKYRVILCGKTAQCNKFSEIFNEWDIVATINSEENIGYNKEMIKMKNNRYDFIMIIDEDKEDKIKAELIKHGIKKPIYYYRYFKTSVIEGFDYRIRELLSKNDVEMIITGSSYTEVGIKEPQLNINAINFALSSQDIFYDYQITKFLLNFSNVKSSVKYMILGLSYYCFDYDLSKSIAKYRVHRYANYIQNYQNNFDEIGINITKTFYQKSTGLKEYYSMNKLKENTIVKYEDKEQEYIAKKNSTMNYDLTRLENKDIFYKFLSLLKINNIKPIIVICPTSQYYYQYFNDGYQKDKFYKILDSFKTDFEFQVIDYFHSNLFEDDDFWDYSHLNGKGAEKFTKILNSEIKW